MLKVIYFQKTTGFSAEVVFFRINFCRYHTETEKIIIEDCRERRRGLSPSPARPV